MSIETDIRDHLADNLNFFYDSLTLIKKEFPLPNFLGSKGYIDILAKDVYNNFVIIEIKRSRTTSRETIQEILKYIGLLKQNFKARDSEIKIIILSTDWNELLVPFSELLYQTSLNVEGFKLILNNSNIPIGKEKILPIDVSQKRNIARSSFLHLFYTDEKRQRCIEYIKEQCLYIGIKDFLLVKLFNDKKRNSDLPYHFAVCFAFQSLSIQEYKNIFQTISHDLDMEQNEFEEDEEFIHFLEQNLLITVDANSYDDGAEAGSPEKIDSILGIQNWQAEDILRFGVFLSDPRYNDDQLLRELRGLDGNSRIRYLNFGESTHLDRIAEIKQSCVNPLLGNDFWKNHLETTFDYLNSFKKPFRFVINVYYPSSIFDTIWRSMQFDNTDYLPTYLFFVDFIEENCLWIFGGRLSWIGGDIDLEELSEFLQDDTDSFLNKFLDCVQGMHDKDCLSRFKLQHENTLAEFLDDKIATESNVRFENGEMIRINSDDRTISEWMEKNKNLKKLLDVFYRQYTTNFY